MFPIYANRSALEVVSCLFVGKTRSIIREEDLKRFYEEYEKLTTMIQVLIRSIK